MSRRLPVALLFLWVLSCGGDRCSGRIRASADQPSGDDAVEGAVDGSTEDCCRVTWPVEDADHSAMSSAFAAVLEQARARRPSGPVSFGYVVASEDELQSLPAWPALVTACRASPDACLAMLVEPGECAWLVLLDEAFVHQVRAEPGWTLDHDCDERRGLWTRWWRSQRKGR